MVPNLAIMNELKYTHRISYMGTGGIESSLVGKSGYPFFRVDCPKLVRSFTLENLKIPYRLKHAKREAIAVLEREKPDLVFSKGGFASYPAVQAAHKLGIPVLTHESDLSPGLCTKLIAKKCKWVLTSFPETASLFTNGKYVGSPIRREILNGERSRAMRKFCIPDGLPVLLVLGGGSGSLALNHAIRSNLPELLKKFRILHLCGTGNLLENPPEGYLQREFEPDMGSAYACADLVLSRAGSNTVFEILALKKPSVLVPLEKSSRGDQLENARYFEKKGLCTVLREESITELPAALDRAIASRALKEALIRDGVSSGTPSVLEIIRECLF